MRIFVLLFLLIFFTFSCHHLAHRDLKGPTRKVPLVIRVDHAIEEKYGKSIIEAVKLIENSAGCRLFDIRHEGPFDIIFEEDLDSSSGVYATHEIIREDGEKLFSLIKLIKIEKPNKLQKVVIAHELGHALGLKHSEDGYIMYEYGSERFTSFSKGDLDLIKTEYCE